MKMRLIPRPKKLKIKTGFYCLNDDCEILIPDNCIINGAIQLADEIENVAFHPRPAIRKGKSLSESKIEILLCKSTGKSREGYSLEIGNGGIEIKSSGIVGLFYGIQTLRQIVSQFGIKLPYCKIIDEPDYPVRGFYHDVTRGMVPKFEDLCSLADKLAHYKINQMQLYIEHTFAFVKHIDVWGGNDPLSAEEIIRLDEYCRKIHIELVPSLTTFGHFYMALRSPRKEHLNELDIKAGKLPFSFRDRMRHYTLDCINKESLKVVTEMIEEYASLFSSKFFNICCDETFDLGKGKNKEKADRLPPGKLYIDFLLKIMQVAKGAGKTPMYWGDIVLHSLSPDLIKKLPKDAIALNWDYSPNLSFGDSKVFAQHKLPFYVCPGVSGWNHWLSDVVSSSKNISGMAKQGKKYGASGLLNTNWGDYGHVNMLGTVFYGILFGADLSWNVSDGANTRSFDEAFDLLEMGDHTLETSRILRKISKLSCATWAAASSWVDQTADVPDSERAPKSGMLKVFLKTAKPEKLLRSFTEIMKLRDDLKKAAMNAKPKDSLAYGELILGAKGTALMHLIVLACQKKEGMKVGNLPYSNNCLADKLRVFEQELRNAWHKRNRPSEYHRLSTVLINIANRIDRL